MNTNVTINLTGTLTLDLNTLLPLIEQLRAPIPQPAERPLPSPILKPKLAYSTEEAAQLLGVDRKTIYRLVERKILRCIGAIRHKRFSHDELMRFIKENTV